MDAGSGNREMRDHVLALLLSGQKSGTRGIARAHAAAAPVSPPSTRRPSAWTPGTHLSGGGGEREREPPLGAMSPVTPERLPLDTDVRLAELTAGLVAASDKERRQTDTIRRLALQLERSERHVRDLQAGAGAEGMSPSPESRKGARSRELDDLRRERREAAKRERSARKEARAAADMLDDIRRHARRVLAERDGHLLTIAQLSEQLDDMRASTAAAAAAADMRTEGTRRPSVPPAPAFSETSLSVVPTPLRGASAAAGNVESSARRSSTRVDREEVRRDNTATADNDEVRTYTGRNVGSTQSALVTRTLASATRHSRGNSMPALGGAQAQARDDAAGSDSERDVTETRGALHADMQEVLDENRQLKAARDAVQAESERLRRELAARDEQLAALPYVDDELQLLETVVDVMELDLSGEKAREMQATITSIGMPHAHAHGSRGPNPHLPNPAAAVGDIVRRVGAVRQAIADKYGQFLEDCFTPTDESLSMPPGNTLQPFPDDTVVSLPNAGASASAPHVVHPFEHDDAAAAADAAHDHEPLREDEAQIDDEPYTAPAAVGARARALGDSDVGELQ